jgi:hypothetical protein
MKPRLSVFSALRETFYLWARNFWPMTLITIATGLPYVAMEQLRALGLMERLGHMRGWHILTDLVTSLLVLAADLFLCSVATAAILGFFARPMPESDPWPAMQRSISTKTWALLRLWLIITGRRRGSDLRHRARCGDIKGEVVGV